MDASKLHVVTVVSNPMRWASRMRLFHEFAHHMLRSGVKLTVIETSLRDRQHHLLNFHRDVTHIAVHHETICWHKESLINIALSRLPRDAEYIAWIDADVRFRNKNWAADAVHALQQYPVIQPWEHAYDLDPNDGHMQVHTSFASLWAKQKPIHPKWSPKYVLFHPGYAWCARREFLAGVGGLLDFAVLGSADSNMAMGLIGRIGETFRHDISPEFTAGQMAWQERAMRLSAYRIGYLPGTIEHDFHGSKASRQYVTRWDILRKHHFNPVVDMYRNMYGVVELADTKPKLRHDVEVYFSQRQEDANVIL